MWESKKSKHPTIIMSLEYEEFCLIEVEKIFKGSLPQYIIDIDIYDILNDSIICYELKEVERALGIIKKEIEELYDDIPLFGEDELKKWVGDFQFEISSL